MEKYEAKVSKNVPYQHLMQIVENKKSGSSLPKKYMDTSTNKVVDFPRKNSLEIYIDNILIYSKLRLKKMPVFEVLENILRGFLEICQNDNGYGGFERFRDLEL